MDFNIQTKYRNYIYMQVFSIVLAINSLKLTDKAEGSKNYQICRLK